MHFPAISGSMVQRRVDSVGNSIWLFLGLVVTAFDCCWAAYPRLPGHGRGCTMTSPSPGAIWRGWWLHHPCGGGSRIFINSKSFCICFCSIPVLLAIKMQTVEYHFLVLYLQFYSILLLLVYLPPFFLYYLLLFIFELSIFTSTPVV